jgi:hypothetical protein
VLYLENLCFLCYEFVILYFYVEFVIFIIIIITFVVLIVMLIESRIYIYKGIYCEHLLL